MQRLKLNGLYNGAASASLHFTAMSPKESLPQQTFMLNLQSS